MAGELIKSACLSQICRGTRPLEVVADCVPLSLSESRALSLQQVGDWPWQGYVFGISRRSEVENLVPAFCPGASAGLDHTPETLIGWIR